MSRLTASAVESIEQEICRKIARAGELQDELTRVDGQIEELRDLLRYASCPKCEAELVGYITDVVDVKNEAAAAGRKDGTCPGCLGAGKDGA